MNTVHPRSRDDGVLVHGGAEASGMAQRDGPATRAGPSPPAERDWISALSTPGPRQAMAHAELHGLMLRAARHQVWRMRSLLGDVGADTIDVLVNQSADEAMTALLNKLHAFEGRSRFTTWAYKFAVLQAAAEVQRVVADDPRAAVEKMSELAREYEQTRATMPSGGERTRRMSEIVARMTVVALGAQSQLSRFASSPQAGDRLAAVVMLKVRFDPAYGPWLADRLVEEPPFVGYHAASALWAACRSLVTAERDKLKALVAAADQKLRSKQLRDDDRDQIIARILE